ncbi:calmodulin-A-like [Lineus longissimus]|uniref:calmodulin-A-like n=1 Tax=Lineus longissimus TaxID=88925 RepID=UPI002B4E3E35
MAKWMREEQVAEFQAAFEAFAGEGSDATITVRELREILKSLSWEDTGAAAASTNICLDMDDNAKIDFDAFLELVGKRLKDTDCEDEIREAFKVFDIDGNGLISADELRQVLMNIGERLTEEEVEEMISTADVDTSGNVDYEEFVKNLVRL